MDLIYRSRPYGIWRTANPATLVVYRILSGFAHLADGLIVILSLGMLAGGFFMEFSEWFVGKLYRADIEKRIRARVARG